MNAIRIAIAFRRPLDLAAYAALLERLQHGCVVAAEEHLDVCLDLCRQVHVDAALFDASYPRFAAFDGVEVLLREGVIRTVAFLDHQFAALRAERAIHIPESIYLTRDHDFVPVFQEMVRRSHSTREHTGRAVLSTDVGVVKYVESPKDLTELDRQGFLTLSTRERQVAGSLAHGISVKAIAKQLGLAESTIDNHKSRLMKKLSVTKQTNLAMLAVRAGLIDES